MGKWLAVQIDMGNRVLMATTSPGDPYCDPRLGNWKATVFDLPGNDFPMLGYDQRGVYIGVNSSNAPPDLAAAASGQAIASSRLIPRVYALPFSSSARMPRSSIRFTTSSSETHHPAIDGGDAEWPYETLIGIDNLSKGISPSLFSPQFRSILSHAKIEVEPFEPIPINYRVRQPDSKGKMAPCPEQPGPCRRSHERWLQHLACSDRHEARLRVTGRPVVPALHRPDDAYVQPGGLGRDLQAPLRLFQSVDPVLRQG